MKLDVIKFSTSCVHCSHMNPKYVPNPFLMPTEKGDRPMSILHVDLTGDLQTQPTTLGNRYLFVIVDAFSKWVQLYPIPNKRASTTASFMWEFIRTFGTPSIVRSDKGTEFLGEFTELLTDL